MKKLILVSLFYFLRFSNCYSQQTWAPTGATWYYTISSQSSQGYSKRVVVADTAINGFPGKKIKQTNYTVDPPFGKLRVDSGFQYFYNDSGIIFGSVIPGTFDTVYNYNAMPGDKWGVPFGSCNDTSFVLVTDTGTITIHNQQLKYKDVVFTGGLFREKDRLIERIGFSGNDPFSIGVYCGTDGTYIFLCSYHDSLISAYPHPDSTCTILPTAVVSVKELVSSLSIYPDPAADFITISTGEQNEEQELRLYDMQGRILLTRQLSAQSGNKVNIYSLPAGIFLAEINGRNMIKRQFFVKQ